MPRGMAGVRLLWLGLVPGSVTHSLGGHWCIPDSAVKASTDKEEKFHGEDNENHRSNFFN